MARKNKIKRKKQTISSALRVRMHRLREKMKKERKQYVANSIISVESSSPPPCLKTELRDWANSHRIAKRALDELLCILNSHGIESVPKNHRTLLGTPVNLHINEIAGGKFWYNGLEKSIRQIFSGIDCDWTISLNVNVDGLPLYKSSKITFWPILVSIYGMCV